MGSQAIFATATVYNNIFGFAPPISAPGKFSGFLFYRINLLVPNLAAAPLAFVPQIAVTDLGFTSDGGVLIF